MNADFIVVYLNLINDCADTRAMSRSAPPGRKLRSRSVSYISVKLDDPSLPAPIYASLHEEGQNPNQFTLIWTRPQAK